MSVPRVGEYATLYGAWVLDRNQHNQVALHLVRGIEVSTSESGAGLTTPPMPGAGSNTAVNKRLKVHMKALDRYHSVGP